MGVWKISAGTALAVTRASCGENSPFAHAADIAVENRSGKTIRGFYGSTVGASIWKENKLDVGGLVDGQAILISFTDGARRCNFDLKTEFQDGSAVVQPDINLCRVSRVVVH